MTIGNEDQKILQSDSLTEDITEVSGDNAPVDELLNDIEHHPDTPEEEGQSLDAYMEDNDLFSEEDVDSELVSDEDDHSKDTSEEYDELLDPLNESKHESAEPLSKGDEELLDDQELTGEGVSEYDEEIEAEVEDQEGGIKAFIDTLKSDWKKAVGLGVVLIAVAIPTSILASNIFKLFSTPTTQPVKQADYLANLGNTPANTQPTVPAPAQKNKVSSPIDDLAKLNAETASQQNPPAHNSSNTVATGISPAELEKMKAEMQANFAASQQAAIEQALLAQSKQITNEDTSDKSMIDNNTQTLILIGKRLQAYEETNNQIKVVLSGIQTNMKQLSNEVDRQAEVLADQQSSIQTIATSVVQLKKAARANEGRLSYSVPKKKKSIPKPTYTLVTASPGIAWVKSIKNRGNLVELHVGDNLIGYGRITAIDAYGEIMTTTGRVQIR